MRTILGVPVFTQKPVLPTHCRERVEHAQNESPSGCAMITFHSRSFRIHENQDRPVLSRCIGLSECLVNLAVSGTIRHLIT